MIEVNDTAPQAGPEPATGDTRLPRAPLSVVLTDDRLDEITADEVHAQMMRAALEIIPHQVLHDTEQHVLLRCRVPNELAGDTEVIVAAYAAWLRAHGTQVTGPVKARKNPYYLTATARVGGIRVEVCGPLPHDGIGRPPQITSEHHQPTGGAA